MLSVVGTGDIKGEHAVRALGAGRRRRVAAVLGGVLLLTCVGFVGFQAYELFTCSGGERSALSEIPQLTRVPKEPEHSNDGSCVVRYVTDAAPEEVLKHYRQQFEAKGWRIVRDEPNQDEASIRQISAEKGSYRYDVVINGFASSGPMVLMPDVLVYVMR